MKKHVHQPSPHTDHAGISICRCGSLATATIHNVPDRTKEQDEHRRRVGENEDA